MDTELGPYDKHLFDVVKGYGTDGVTVVDLCSDTGLRVQTVSKQLFTLEQRGLVETCGSRKSRATGRAGLVRRAAWTL